MNDNDNDDEDNDNDEDDDDMYVTERLFDFDINTGKEMNDLLPPLGRKLNTGIECYYIVTDKLVQNLVSKTQVNYIDACWALEACKGDITEAWTRISVARRTKLNTKRYEQIIQEDNIEQQQQQQKNNNKKVGETTTTVFYNDFDDNFDVNNTVRSTTDDNMIRSSSSNNNMMYDDDDKEGRMEDYDIEMEEEYTIRKQILKEQQRKLKVDQYFNNEPILPDTPWLPTKNPKPVDDEPWFTG